jgi:hypothetical protein
MMIGKLNKPRIPLQDSSSTKRETMSMSAGEGQSHKDQAVEEGEAGQRYKDQAIEGEESGKGQGDQAAEERTPDRGR